MIEIFARFGDLLIYPLYHFANDCFMGVLFYMLLIFWVFNLLFMVSGK